MFLSQLLLRNELPGLAKPGGCSPSKSGVAHQEKGGSLPSTRASSRASSRPASRASSQASTPVLSVTFGTSWATNGALEASSRHRRSQASLQRLTGVGASQGKLKKGPEIVISCADAPLANASATSEGRLPRASCLEPDSQQRGIPLVKWGPEGRARVRQSTQQKGKTVAKSYSLSGRRVCCPCTCRGGVLLVPRCGQGAECLGKRGKPTEGLAQPPRASPRVACSPRKKLTSVLPGLVESSTGEGKDGGTDLVKLSSRSARDEGGDGSQKLQRVARSQETHASAMGHLSVPGTSSEELRRQRRSSSHSVLDPSDLPTAPVRNRRASMPAVSLPGAPNPGGRLTALLPRAVDDVMEACKVAKECLIAVPTVQQAFKIFKQYATTPDEGGSVVAGGRLTRAQFASLLSKALGFGHEEDAEGDKELTESAFKYAKDTIGFQDFAMWYDQHSFTEGLNVPSGERRQRRFAKELNMSTSEMDTYRKTFDIVDDDGNGVLEFPEFEEMLHSLFKVPNHIRISTNRISQLWKDCDADGNGVIDFEEFVVFYRKYFAKGGFDAYYQQAK